MNPSIHTPYGVYEPVALDETDKQRALTVMGEAVEAIAEINHDGWAAQRINDGWRYGEKRDDDRKHHPCLVAYEHLPDHEKKYDRQTAMSIVAGLMKRNLLRTGRE